MIQRRNIEVRQLYGFTSRKDTNIFLSIAGVRVFGIACLTSKINTNI